MLDNNCCSTGELPMQPMGVDSIRFGEAERLQVLLRRHLGSVFTHSEPRMTEMMTFKEGIQLIPREEVLELAMMPGM